MKNPPRLVSLTKQTPYICYNCRKTWPLLRPYRTSRAYSTNPSIPPSSGYTFLKSRRLIHLAGPDSTHYLQGAITANIQPQNPDINPRQSGFYAAFLNAQGRVLNDVFIYPFERTGTDWLIEVDANEAEKLVRHIKKYKLRAKFQVRVLEQDEVGVWFRWDDSQLISSSSTRVFPPTSASTSTPSPPNSKAITCLDSRAPNFGQRIILNLPNEVTLSNVMEAGGQEFSIPRVDETTYQIRRYLHGIPEGQDEILRESALVQESNIDYMGGVDYRKGCYVGQELTIRTHHTGVVRKRIMPLMLYDEKEKEPQILEYKSTLDAEVSGRDIEGGTSIGRVGKTGRSVGKWLAGVGNLGLGLVRVEVMTPNVEDGFKMNGTEGLKVKAFVPSWHVNR